MIAGLLKNLVLDWLQHALVVGGAGIVSSGYLSASDEQKAIGAVITLVGLVWSAADEYATSKLQKNAAITAAQVQKGLSQ